MTGADPSLVVDAVRVLLVLALAVAIGAALSGCAVNSYGVVVPFGTDVSIDPQAYQ